LKGKHSPISSFWKTEHHQALYKTRGQSSSLGLGSAFLPISKKKRARKNNDWKQEKTAIDERGNLDQIAQEIREGIKKDSHSERQKRGNNPPAESIYTLHQELRRTTSIKPFQTDERKTFSNTNLPVKLAARILHWQESEATLILRQTAQTSTGTQKSPVRI